MQSAFISRANFRLAHLMLSKTITNLVVTTNFDDFLSRALTLFGNAPIVCDHPATLQRIDLNSSSDVQIIHVHGSYWFYDCCNLREEIATRAEPARNTSFTMLAMLDDILRLHSPLIVGYSGWEGDVFMNALQRRLAAGLGTNLYWFCYRRRDADGLPLWLKANANVRIVVPDGGSKGAPVELPGSGTGEAKALGKIAGAISGLNEDEPVLGATTVFDELIRTFELKVPELTSDPLGFFASQLERSLLGPADQTEEPEDDVYAIRSVISLIAKVNRYKEQIVPLSETETLIESFRNAVRQSHHREAIRLALNIPVRHLTSEQLREIVAALFSAGRALNDNSVEELASYDRVVSIVAGAEIPGRDVSLSERVAKALLYKGVSLGALDRGEEEIGAYDEVARRFGDAPEAVLREQVATALFNKGVTLGALNRGEKAIAVYDEVARRFGDAPEAVLREQVAPALFNKGVRLGALNRGEEAIVAYDDVPRRFRDAPESVLREQAAKALV
ncbi:MAG: SIR2 family protein, partial [Bryobacteraceae bacterium]